MSDDIERVPGKRLSLNEVKIALKACGGSLPRAASALEVDLYRLSRYVAVRPKLREFVERLRNMLVDVAEGHFSDAVMDGETWAVKMALSTLGKNRGYTSKSEIDHRLINTTDPTKMSDTQLQQMVEERAARMRLEEKKRDVIEVKPVITKVKEPITTDFADVGLRRDGDGTGEETQRQDKF